MPAAMTARSIHALIRPAANLLTDRVVLITGASDGIGKAVAQAAAAHGATRAPARPQRSQARSRLRRDRRREASAAVDRAAGLRESRARGVREARRGAGAGVRPARRAAAQRRHARRARADRASRHCEVDAHDARQRHRAVHPHALLPAAAEALCGSVDRVHVERRRAASARVLGRVPGVEVGERRADAHAGRRAGEPAARFA